MRGPASLGGVDIAASGCFLVSATAMAMGLGSGGGMGWLGTLGAISGAGFMLAPKGCVAKLGPPKPVHRTEHPSGAPIVACSHVRTGPPGGSVYIMGLSVPGKNRGCRAPGTEF
jgi:hypothetical protein